MNHTSGHLPFAADVTGKLRSGPNVLTVAVNNTLSHATIPSADFTYKTDTTLFPSALAGSLKIEGGLQLSSRLL